MDLTRKALDSLLTDSLQELMALICQEIERIAPDALVFIMRVDEQGILRLLVGSGLSVRQVQVLEELLASTMTGCSAMQSVDTAGVSVAQGLRTIVVPWGTSCWAKTIHSGNGRMLGALAVQLHETSTPSPLHRSLIDTCVPLCALALEREESRARLHRMAFYDELTGLPNRSLLLVRAGQAVVQAQCDKGTLAVLFIDLDRFKRVNNSLGRTGGDELLCLIARCLEQGRCRSDIVARLSGDEFVLVLPQCSGQQAAMLARQLLVTLGKPCRVADVPLVPSASIGISLFPGDGHDIDTLIHRADMAMCRAKIVGSGRFCFFSEELKRSALELPLENALRAAIEQNQLQLYYQPQIFLREGLLHGVEALARWRHPQLGDISPASFVPLAEQCGLIDALGRWVLHEACRQLAVWRQRGLEIPAVSINLSPSNFHDLDLPAVIASTLAQYGLKGTDLTLEITESVLMDNTPGFRKTLHQVHAQGVSLAMDDFGTGFSSLSHLHRLPIGELKLDRSFVYDLERDNTSRTLSRAVIGLGESLRLTVVAEGIETEGQRRILKQLGYHVGQGYLFSPPLPPDELEIWLAERPLRCVSSLAPQD